MASLATGDIGASSRVTACGGCRLADRCSADAVRAPGPLRGPSLVGASLLSFLMPAVLALVGSALAGAGSVRQLLGGLTGLLAGMLIASLAARRLPARLAREECFEPR